MSGFDIEVDDFTWTQEIVSPVVRNRDSDVHTSDIERHELRDTSELRHGHTTRTSTLAIDDTDAFGTDHDGDFTRSDRRRQGNPPSANVHPRSIRLPREDIGGSEEAGRRQRRRRVVEITRTADRTQGTPEHEADPVTHGPGFFLIVRHVHECETHIALDFGQLDLQLLPQLSIESAERFIEQKYSRAQNKSTREGHSLLFTS